EFERHQAEVSFRLKVDYEKEYQKAKEESKPFPKYPTTPLVRHVTTGLIGNVVNALGSMSLLRDDVELGSWLGADGTPTRRNVIAMRNGLFDVDAWLRGDEDVLRPLTPKWFSTAQLPYEYDPGAACPTFMKVMNKNLEKDQERINLLLEWYGHTLV